MLVSGFLLSAWPALLAVSGLRLLRVAVPNNELP
jgi:hypothetical protein